MNNRNHPQKGSTITVEPVRSLEHIRLIKKHLADCPRDLLLFVLGINNGLRTGDLLKLRVQDLRYLKVGECKTVTEGKTKKQNFLMLNKESFKVLHKFLDEKKLNDEEYLFPSRKTKGAIKIQRVNAMIKQWTRDLGIKGNFGAHSLRKTFGYVQRTEFGVSFEILCKRFNHSSPSVTMRYLGLQSKEVNDILLNCI